MSGFDVSDSMLVDEHCVCIPFFHFTCTKITRFDIGIPPEVFADIAGSDAAMCTVEHE